MNIKYIFICLMYAQFIKTDINKVDLIIFSRDRAMQLYALLESTEKYIKNLSNIYLIFYTSNDAHLNSYEQIKKRFNNLNLIMIQQGNNPKEDFKLILNDILKKSNEYILFSVDDIIITQEIDLNECINILDKLESEKININGFYFRLGKNITCSYPNNIIKQPELRTIAQNIFIWKFNEGAADWAYPNSLDMVLFNKSKIIDEIINLNFHSPNTLEGNWNQIANLNNFGICFEHSKIVNIPANLVQQDWINPAQNSFTTQELLSKFNENYKININRFYQLSNMSPHSNENYEFIEQ